ncbi:DUF4389 domain-containing protein [Parathalassolituus penaei]|uniref:DUF4389 domain-containing protein n=1 Tax=Parathalassolituus penaei TaxID=2997323 RepID=A0A9X3ED75_9GAMM|nr:DUF4389 domain-containing protein [Parathalassolituus penaei]MCY0965448.1 DUF4389 domain-containing protein [Parathalassolituus penaei]
MRDSEFKSNLTSDRFWLRTIYTVIFVIVVRVLDLMLLLLTLVQWVYQLLSGRGHDRLNGFCHALGEYYRQVVHYLTGCTDEKPYPFSDWPKQQGAPAKEVRSE